MHWILIRYFQDLIHTDIDMLLVLRECAWFQTLDQRFEGRCTICT